MTIYGITFQHGLFLAPLSGYTNWPMRVLCRRYGAELAYTEMISTVGLLRRERNTLRLLQRPAHDRPLIAQIFSNKPEESALAARMLEDEGFDGIDINMGCPVKKVIYKGCGAALMRDVDTAQAMVAAVAGAVKIPVSVKMRSGWDRSSMNADRLASTLEERGAQCIIIHPRTRADMYKGTPYWEMLALIRQAVRVPVIASGDIHTARDLEALRVLGADAFMIGRAAIGRPWIFLELTGGAPPTLPDRRDLVLEHLDALCTYMGELRGVRYMRKFLSSYVKGLPGATRFREAVGTIEEPHELHAFITDFFQAASEAPAP